MTSIPSTPSAALAILQQLNASVTPPQSSADKLIAVSTGQPNIVSVSKQPNPAQSKVSEAMFSMNGDSIAKQKLELIERTGKALGIVRNDYASMDDFVAAMKKAFGELKVQPGAAGAIHGLEKELGLDKLGLSLEDVISSATEGGDNDKVTRALEKRSHQKDDDKKDGDGEANKSVVIDHAAASLYSLLSFS
ncbi:hypothetical protein [Rhizobium sp. BR 314]|uniref:hypothetical protein n=1 Tax=Rhizobium sp. BR 314 TaxID=3040013 RepID=UPI0039BF959A